MGGSTTNQMVMSIKHHKTWLIVLSLTAGNEVFLCNKIDGVDGGSMIYEVMTRWWFQTFFIFTPTLGNDPIWPIFFQQGWNHQLDDVFFCSFQIVLIWRDLGLSVYSIGSIGSFPLKAAPDFFLVPRWTLGMDGWTDSNTLRILGFGIRAMSGQAKWYRTAGFGIRNGWTCTSPKSNMTMEHPPFEAVFPIENGDFPMSC